MRLLLAAVTLFSLAGPAFAEDASAATAPDALPNYAEEQMCYTWLSMAANFAEPAETRAEWGRLTLRIRDHVEPRTDGDKDKRDADRSAAIAEANKYIMAQATAKADERPKLVSDMLAKAEACKPMVPPEPDA